MAANDGGIHEEFLPADGNIQRAVELKVVIGDWRRRLKSPEDLVIRWDPLRRSGARRAIGIQRRHLPKRKIFSEARCGAAIACAGQQCEKGAASGIGLALATRFACSSRSR